MDEYTNPFTCYDSFYGVVDAAGAESQLNKDLQRVVGASCESTTQVYRNMNWACLPTNIKTNNLSKKKCKN